MKNIIIAIVILATLPLTGCASMNNAQKGAAFGTAVGTAVGALIAKDKIVGAAIGAGVGAVFGYMAGNEMDKFDQAQIRRVAETVPSGNTATWTNPDTGQTVQASPRPAIVERGSVFRNVIVVAEDGTRITVKVRLLPDGTWEIV